MIKVARKIPQAHRLHLAAPVVDSRLRTAATSAPRLLAFHWHLDPLTRRPTMHLVLTDARAACPLEVTR